MLISVPENKLEQPASFKAQVVIGQLAGSEFENRPGAEKSNAGPLNGTTLECCCFTIYKDERHGEGSCVILKFGIWSF